MALPVDLLAAFNTETGAILTSVATGATAPSEAIVRMSTHWAPAELFDAETHPGALTRQDTIASLDELAGALERRGELLPARRISMLAVAWAERARHEEILDRCAETLARLLRDDPSARRERLALLETTTRRILRSERGDTDKAIALAELAGARAAVVPEQSFLHPMAVDAIQQALAYGERIPPEALAHIHFIAGRVYMRPDAGEEDMALAITSLREAVETYSRLRDMESLARALYNLAMPVRELGVLLNDKNIVEYALAVCDHALTDLPLTDDMRGRFEKRREATLEQLRKMTDAGPVQSDMRGNAIWTLFGEVDRSLRESMNTADPVPHRNAAAAGLARAGRLLARDAPPRERAELLHRMALLFFDAGDDDQLWTGFCLANAASRFAAGAWYPASLARLVSHRAEMLMKIGIPSSLPHLRKARDDVRTAISVLYEQTDGSEIPRAEVTLTVCLGHLALAGDATAGTDLRSLVRPRAAERMDEALQAEAAGAVEKHYLDYFHLVHRIAGERLIDVFCDVEVALVNLACNQSIDESLRSRRLIAIAGAQRDVGYFSGAVRDLKDAEKNAEGAHYSAPAVLCEVARAWARVPSPRDARRCIDKAREILPFAITSREATELPADGSWWFAEAEPEEYENVIQRTAELIETEPELPSFDPAATAALFDESIRQEIRRRLEEMR